MVESHARHRDFTRNGPLYACCTTSDRTLPPRLVGPTGVDRLEAKRDPSQALLTAVRIVVLMGVLSLSLLAGCGDAPGPPSRLPSVEGPERASPPLAPEFAEVPNVEGEDGQDAVDTLEAEGFTVSFSQDDGRDPAGCTVDSQDPIGEAEPGTEIVLELNCRQVDWENQEGEDWESFSTAYSTGWDEGCEEAFSLSPDGTLHSEDDQQFTTLDCPSAEDPPFTDVPSEVPDDPEAVGQELGVHDGCVSVFEDLSLSGELYYGDDVFSANDCPQARVLLDGS